MTMMIIMIMITSDVKSKLEQKKITVLFFEVGISATAKITYDTI